VRKKSKIIFINRFFFPDHSATSQILTDLAMALTARGSRVQVITSRLRYDAPDQRLAPRETLEGVEIARVATSGFGRGNLVGRAFDYLTFYLSAACVLLRRLRPGDVVVAKTDPPMLSLIAAPVAWMRGARLINWLQDIFPETAEVLGVGGGRFGKSSMSLLKRLRNASLRRAHLNIVLGTKMARRVEACGVPPARIRVIHNWADGKLIHPIAPQHNHLRRAWGLSDAFVVGYSGNFGRAHDIETLLDAIVRLERTTLRPRIGDEAATYALAASGGYVEIRASTAVAPRPIRWLFVGGGALSRRLRSEVERLGLKSVQFRPYQPRDRLAETLCVPDVHLISLRPELEGFIVPSKYYGIVAAGRPAIFIGDGDGEIARILLESATGKVVPEGDGAALAEAVSAYARNPPLPQLQGSRARRLFEERFDVAFAIKAWEQVITEART
jgi:colanic acid biosynthesis glycosyl transferase WcaI